jgi:hypothetical protein
MLGIAQTSLAIPSLNRNFLNATEKNAGFTIKLFSWPQRKLPTLKQLHSERAYA